MRIPDDGPVDLDGFSQLTIDAWIYPNVVDGEGEVVVSKYDSRYWVYPNGVSYYLSVRDGKLRMCICESVLPRWENAYIISDETVIIPEDWTHVAGVWKGDIQFEFYVNGMPVDGTVTTRGVVDGLYMANNDVPVNIGRVESIQVPPTPTSHFDGLIDEVEIFDRALTQSEIHEIYSAGSDGKLKRRIVDIDIKPGSDPNSVCLNVNGLLPVAILGEDTFDVSNIDASTVELGGVDITSRGSAKAPKIAYSFEDVNGDGYTDLMAFFSVPDLVGEGVLAEMTTALTLTANLYDGTPIEGMDSVRVVPP